jgi:hypothetical protein
LRAYRERGGYGERDRRESEGGNEGRVGSGDWGVDSDKGFGGGGKIYGGQNNQG